MKAPVIYQKPLHEAAPDFSVSSFVSRLLIVVALLVVALGGWWLFKTFRHDQETRALLQWEQQLSVVAEGRAAAVSDWYRQQFGALDKMAQNTSLRLYATEYTQDNTPNGADKAAQATYLRMLVQLSAERAGFAGAEESVPMPANQAMLGQGGIALLDVEYRPIVSSKGMLPIDGALEALLKEHDSNKPMFWDSFVSPSDTPMAVFIMPVYAVQGDQKPEDMVGILLGIKPFIDEVSTILRQSAAPWEYGKTQLLRQNASQAQVIASGDDASIPKALSLSLEKTHTAIAQAVQTPAGFGKGLSSDGAIELLYASRPIASYAALAEQVQSGWIVMHTVPIKEALKEYYLEQQKLVWIVGSAVITIILLLLVVWRHASSLRSARAAGLYKRLSRQLFRQEALLKLIMDHEPDGMYIVDEGLQIRYANRSFSERYKLEPKDAAGKMLVTLLGGPATEMQQVNVNKALASNKPLQKLEEVKQKGKTILTLQVNYIPLQYFPDPVTGEKQAGVLIVEQDISATMAEKDRHQNTLEALVSSLMLVIDARDTYAANHSDRVSRLAGYIANEMELDNVSCETVQVSGKLMNLGKIFVPEALLMRDGPLKKAEVKQVRESIARAADMLEGIQFDGPVVDTIRQSQEHWDGSGLLGLKGEKTLITARIIAAANAFVGMMSARAYRQGKSTDEVLDAMLGDIGHQFDRKVVVALGNFLENHQHHEDWLIQDKKSKKQPKEK